MLEEYAEKINGIKAGTSVFAAMLPQTKGIKWYWDFPVAIFKIVWGFAGKNNVLKTFLIISIPFVAIYMILFGLVWVPIKNSYLTLKKVFEEDDRIPKKR